MSADVIEILTDLHASPSSEQRLDYRARKPMHTPDRDCVRPLKRRVEVSARNLTRSDRDAFTAAKQKKCRRVWTTGEESFESPMKPYPPCPVGVGLDKRPKAQARAVGFQDPRLTNLPTSSRTLTFDGESAILQCVVNDGAAAYGPISDSWDLWEARERKLKYHQERQ